MKNWWEESPTAEEYARTATAPRVPVLEPAEPPSAMVRFSKGVNDLVEGTKQLALHATDPEGAKAYDKQLTEEEAYYQRGRGEDAGVDALRLGGNIAGSVPAAAAAAFASPGAPAAASGAVLGGLGAAMTPVTGVTQNEDGGSAPYWLKKGAQTVFGTVFGAAAPWATKTVGNKLVFAGDKLNRFARGQWLKMAPGQKGQLLTALSEASSKAGVGWDDLDDAVRGEMVEDAIRSFKINGNLDADAIVRAKNFERFGFVRNIAPMKGQISRNPADWTAERNLAKLDEAGAPIRDRVLGQNAHITSEAEKAAQSFSPVEAPSFNELAYRVGDQVKGAVQNAAKASQREVSAAYDTAANTPGIGERVIDAPSLRGRLTEIYDAFGDKIPAQIRTKIEAIVNGDTGHSNRLAPTVQNINEVIKTLNARSLSPADEAERAAMSQLRDSLRGSLDDLAANGGEGASALREASKLAAKRFGIIGRNRAESRKIVDDLIYEKTSSDKFLTTKVINGDTDSLDHLRRFLLHFPEEFNSVDRSAGQQAWDSIRAGVVRNMLAKAKPNENFSGQMFKKAWDALGARRDVLFNPQEREVLNALVKAGYDLTTEPVGTYVNRSNTTPAMMNFLSNTAKLPIVGRVATNILSQAQLAGQFSQKLAEQRAVQAALASQQSAVPSLGAQRMAEMLYGGGRYFPGAGQIAAPAAGMLAGAAPRALNASSDPTQNRQGQ